MARAVNCGDKILKHVQCQRPSLPTMPWSQDLMFRDVSAVLCSFSTINSANCRHREHPHGGRARAIGPCGDLVKKHAGKSGRRCPSGHRMQRCSGESRPSRVALSRGQALLVRDYEPASQRLAMKGRIPCAHLDSVASMTRNGP